MINVMGFCFFLVIFVNLRVEDTYYTLVDGGERLRRGRGGGENGGFPTIM